LTRRDDEPDTRPRPPLPSGAVRSPTEPAVDGVGAAAVPR
jgi:hypothetical protein